MVKVIGKIMENGNIIGFAVERDGFIEAVIPDWLYTSVCFLDMIDAGYKYVDMNPMNVCTPEGTPLSELPVTDMEFPAEERFMYENSLHDSLMSEAEVSKHFAFKADNARKFMPPIECLIKTREELFAYLEDVNRQINKYGFILDNRPLNSFVAPEALFSCEEIASPDSQIRYYFNIINQRHLFRDYAMYKVTVDWLIEQGVLKNSNPTYLEFITAYYAWGVDGIKDICTDVSTKLGADGFSYVRTDYIVDSPSTSLENRTDCVALWDSNENLHYLNKKVNFSDVTEMGRQPLVLKNTGALFELRRSGNWGHKYQLVPAYAERKHDRVYFNYLSENGYTYTIRTSHDCVTIFAGKTLIMNSANFAIRSINPYVTFTLDEVNSNVDYLNHNLALLKAGELLKATNVPTPHSNTFEMLLADGVSHQAAINFMIACIADRNTPYESNHGFHTSAGSKVPNFAGALEDYCGPTPDGVFTKYDIDPELIETPYDLCDFIDLEGEFASALEGDSDDGVKIKKKKNEVPLHEKTLMMAEEQKEKDIARYVDNVTFIRNVLDGNVVINAFGDGLKKDRGLLVHQVANILLTTAYVETGSKEEVAGYLSSITKESLPYDTSSVLKVYDNAAKGYRIDLADSRRCRAGHAWAWVWVNRVYREISNNPNMDDVRHYMMEVTLQTDSKVREAIYDKVYDAIEAADLPEEVKNIGLLEAWYHASKIWFVTMQSLNKWEDTMTEHEDHFTFTLPLDNNHTVDINFYFDEIEYLWCTFDAGENTKFITLYDYARLEFNGAWEFYAVNANVTAWHVFAKPGFQIPTHNFYINWWGHDRFSNFSAGYQNALMGTAIKPMQEYSMNMYGREAYILDDEMVHSEQSEVTCATMSHEELMFYTNAELDETPRAYNYRWLKLNDEVSNSEEVLFTMPLKSDIVYKNLLPYIGVPGSSVYTTVPVNEVRKLEYITTTACIDCTNVIELSSLGTAIAMAGITCKRFEPNNFQFNTITNWRALLDGTYYPTGNIAIAGDKIVVLSMNKEPLVVDYKEKGLDFLEGLAAVGLAYQLDSTNFLMRTYLGDLVLEVK